MSPARRRQMVDREYPSLSICPMVSKHDCLQSPPARAEATSVIILSPVLARSGTLPKSRCFWRN